MRRTLKLLGLIGAAGAAAVAAARRTVSRPGSHPDPGLVPSLPNVSEELSRALHRFDERFGA